MALDVITNEKLKEITNFAKELQVILTAGSEGNILSVDSLGKPIWVNDLLDSLESAISSIESLLSSGSEDEIIRADASGDPQWSTALTTLETAVSVIETLLEAGASGDVLETNSSGNPEWTDKLSIILGILYGGNENDVLSSDGDGIPEWRATLPIRTYTLVSDTTPNPDCANYDMYILTALSGNASIAAPTGTPTQGQKFMFRIKDNGSSRNLSWDAAYRSLGVDLPTTTTASKTMYVGFIYNSTDSKWDCVAFTEQA